MTTFAIRGGDELRTVHIDRAGDVWAGNVTDFGVYHHGRFEPQGIAQGYTDSGCFLIYQAPSGALYAGGRESLYKRDDGGRWRAIHDGMDRARSMVMAHDGILWVASGSGIHRYRNGTWISNGVDEGLPSSVIYRVFEDSSGRIWAGTTRGIAMYHPDADTDPPTTFISEEQNSHQVSPDGQARLVFSGMDKWKQTLPDRLLFSWRLDEGTWGPFSSATYAGFKDLPVGTRRFEVRAMDRNGNIDPRPATFGFSVLPPWYRNPAFRVTAGLAALCIIVLLASAILSYRQRGRLIAELKLKKRLEADRQVILEMVAHRVDLPTILLHIARSISTNCPGSLCGVIRVSEGRREVSAEPELSDSLKKDLASIPVGLSFDELSKNLQNAAARHALSVRQLAAIRSGDDELLGVIAVFLLPVTCLRQGIRSRSGEVVRFDGSVPFEVPLVVAMSNLAGAAIDNARLYERLVHQAGHDALTGLPNRLAFESRLQDAVSRAKKSARPLAVFFLDLDQFKQINDSLGHTVGDLFLKQVASRLGVAIPAAETLARIGGDEFTLLLEQRADPSFVAQTANRMLQALRAPCRVEGHQLVASASIGISLYPQDGDDPVALQKHADSAMYRAKCRGGNCYEFHAAEMARPAESAGSGGLVVHDALDGGGGDPEFVTSLERSITQRP